MKFVIYRGRKKITVDNAWMSDINNLAKLMNESSLEELSLSDLRNIQITSVQGLLADDMGFENEEIEMEIFDGIKWRQETVN